MPSTTLSVEIEGEVYEAHAQGDGQYDAFINALHKIYDLKNIALPALGGLCGTYTARK